MHKLQVAHVWFRLCEGPFPTERSAQACKKMQTNARRPIPTSCSRESLLEPSSPRKQRDLVVIPEASKDALSIEVNLTYMHQRLISQLSRLPVQSSGIALNVVAMSGLVDLMVRVDHKREPFLVPIRNVLCMEGTVLLGLYVARTLCSRDFVGGLSSRTVVSSHSIFFTCLQLLFSHPGTAERFGGLTMARYIAHTSGVVNLLLNVRFLHLCARRRALAEPSWFPTTVSPAAICHVGATVGTPQWVRFVGLTSGCIATAILWPICVYRALRSPRRVACNPSIFILIAPIPFVTMAM